MYSEILVPTDGSETSEAAVKNAVYLADRCDARVHGLFVADSGPLESIGGGYPEAVSKIEELGDEAVERVRRAGDERGVETETSVVRGTVHRTIREYTDDNDIDTVVMGTHGRRGVGRHLLGSVTERIIRTVDVPVVAVTKSGESTD
jgi:nucleotide-binding universal stress UspA family protein